MKVTCGTDIIEISRIRKSIEEMEDKFIGKIFTTKEIQYCESKKAQRYQHYAARFAAKEAIFKAISPLLKDKFDIGWRNIEILNNEQGRPYANLLTNDVKKVDIDISLSHIKEYAIATAVVKI